MPVTLPLVLRYPGSDRGLLLSSGARWFYRDTSGDPVPDAPIAASSPILLSLTNGQDLDDRVIWATPTLGEGWTLANTTRTLSVNGAAAVAYATATVATGDTYQVFEEHTATKAGEDPVTIGPLHSAERTVQAAPEGAPVYPDALSVVGVGFTDPVNASGVTEPDFTGATLSSFTTASSVSYNGKTWIFDRPVKIVTAICGEPMVVADQYFEIIDEEPEWQIINNGTTGTPYEANGSMIDPGYKLTEQGWDHILHIGVLNKGGTGKAAPYNAALNVSPTRTGNGPIEVPQGSAFTIVSTLRLPGMVGGAQTDNGVLIEKAPAHVVDWSALTIIPEIPPADSFRPAMNGDMKYIFGHKAMVDWSVLRDLDGSDLTYGGFLSGSDYRIETLMRFGFGSSGERQRRFAAGPLGNYAASLGTIRGQALCRLHDANADPTQREVTFNRTIQAGIDVFGQYCAGWRGGKGAGQHHGYLAFLYFAGFALQNQQMIAAAQNLIENTSASFTFMPETWRGRTVGTKNGNKQVTPMFEAGRPIWLPNTGGERENIRGNLSVPYGQNILTTAEELPAILMLRNGPNGVTGEEAWLGAEPTSGPRHAALLAIDWDLPWRSGVSLSALTPNSGNRTFWNFVRDNFTVTPRFEGRPTVMSDVDHLTTRGADWVALSSDAPIAVTNPPVTQIDARVSFDTGKSWTIFEDIEPDEPITVGPARDVRLQTALTNDYGRGPWTATSQRLSSLSPAEYGVLTTTGTALAEAPSITSPQLSVPIWRRGWDLANDHCEVAPANPDSLEGITDIFVGWGWLNGGRPDTASYQFALDGVPIAGASEQGLPVLREFLEGAEGKVLSATVELSNTHGTTGPVSVINSITLPDPLFPPNETGLLYRHNFQHDFYDLPTVWGGGFGGTIHLRRNLFRSTGTTPGAIMLAKTSDGCRLRGFIDLSSLIGQEIIVETLSATDNTSSPSSQNFANWSSSDARWLDGNYDIKFFKNAAAYDPEVGAQVQGETEIPATRVFVENGGVWKPGTAVRVTSDAFVVDGAKPYLMFDFRVNTGGPNGGNPNFTDINIWTSAAYVPPVEDGGEDEEAP